MVKIYGNALVDSRTDVQLLGVAEKKLILSDTNKYYARMTENKITEKIDFNETKLDQEYYKCRFKACNFSKITIQDSSFDDCVFDSCDFTLCKFQNVMRDIEFKECKMVGVDFTNLNKFSNGITFEKSHLNYANFEAVKMNGTIFKNCTINEACFDSSDLKQSIFDDCDLARTSFHETNLEKVDFSKSFNFSINPSNCNLKKAIFSENELRGLLTYLDIIIKP